MTRFLYGRELIVATDRETPYLDRLRNAFRRRPGIVVERFDPESSDVSGLDRYQFDTVVCINILEQMADDEGALRRMHDVLAPGGTIIVYVPAGKSLFGPLDRGVGHQRRYDRLELSQKLIRAGFEVKETAFQNQAGRFGWWVNSKILRRKELPLAQSGLFDRLVPLFRALEPPNPSSGLSLLAVGRRPSAATPAEAKAEQAAGVPA